MDATPPSPSPPPERQATLLDDDINDMFDLAAPPLEKPVVARLIPVSDGLEVITLHIDDACVTIGRSKDLPAPYRIEKVDKLSGKHCDLVVDPSTLRVSIRDTSTNGTLVNHARIAKGELEVLKSGDRITLARPNTSRCSGADGGGVEFFFQRVKEETSIPELESSLTCSICQSVYLRPCSVLPCLHTFCAHCISQWVDGGHDSCAECRSRIQSIRPSHKIQSCVEQLLRSNPRHHRPSQERAELERLDTVPPGGRVLRTRREADDDISSGDEEWENSEGSDDDDDNNGPQRLQQFRPALAARVALAPVRCRQCDTPSVLDGFQCCSGGTTADADASEAAKATSSPMHLQCRACWKPFPDRPMCGRPQRCFLCLAPYCNLYFAAGDGGCAVQGGDGASNPSAAILFKPFEDHVITVIPPQTFAGNQVEQTILRNYLAAEQVSVEEMIRECYAHFREGSWKPDLHSISGEITSQSAVCMTCAHNVLAALLFHYRRAIPNDKLPESVTNRPHCWYGLQCRTQSHNVKHAQNYHHVCYQEKRKE